MTCGGTANYGWQVVIGSAKTLGTWDLETKSNCDVIDSNAP